MASLIFCLIFVKLFLADFTNGHENPISCSREARQLTKFHLGGNFTAVCSVGCLSSQATVKGSRIYTDDSSICKAAIHAGVINNNGGPVKVQSFPGKRFYRSTVHNGITSRESGSWTHSSSFKFASTLCVHPVGLQNAGFPDSNFKASSVYREWWRFSGAWEPYHARLDKSSTINAWRPDNNDVSPWWEIDLGKIYDVRGIVTQGSKILGKVQYITTYKIQYKLIDKSEWNYALNEKGETKTFSGNSDNNGRVTNNFVPSLIARYLRLLPIKHRNHISLRAEILVCDLE